MNYFELFNCSFEFNLNDEQLKSIKNRFYQLQKQFHPDRFANHSASEQLQALQKSSMINDAYKTLIDPIKRGLYILTLVAEPLQLEHETKFDNGFLMQLMEWQEEQDNIEIQKILQNTLLDYQKLMNDAFSLKDWTTFKQLIKQSIMVQKLIKS